MELMNATAMKSARQVTTRYGERFVVECRLETGETTALWGPTDLEGLGSIGQGQTFLVGRHRSGKLSFVDSQPETVEPAPLPQPMGFRAEPEVVMPPAPPSGIAPHVKAAIAADVSELAKLWGYCFQQARQVLPADVEEETARCCASSLYISVTRKHHLG